MTKLDYILKAKINKFLEDNPTDAYSSNEISQIFSVEKDEVVCVLNRMVILGQVWELKGFKGIKIFKFRPPSIALISYINLFISEVLTED